MLIVTRREDQVVLIGDPANPIGRVEVTSIRGDRVRIGFDFPHGLKITRAELCTEAAEPERKPARPTVQVSPSPEGLRRDVRLGSKHREILKWLVGKAGVGSDDLDKVAATRRWNKASFRDLLAWGLIERDEDGSVRLTQYGVDAVDAYSKWTERT